MGKSIRSKVKKRFRTLKRQYYDQGQFFPPLFHNPSIVIGNEKLGKLSESLQNNPGHHDKKDIPAKNAFLYPNDPDAVFPKFERGIPLDFRNANIDSSGYEFRGSSRKSQAKAAAAAEGTNIEGLDIELEEIPEANQQAEDDMIDIDEDDLLTDFGTMGIGGATKKIKKNKFTRMDTEGSKDFIPLNSKRSQAKARSGCKRSKKIMKW